MPRAVSAILGWFDRIIAIQERRPYRFLVCFSIAAFVGIVRFLLEWMVGHRTLISLNLAILTSVSFYVLVLFLYTVPLVALVRQPMRRSMNVVMAAVFCGIIPPVIDGVVSGIGGFRYEYVFDFPRGWPWTLYAPNGSIPVGEAFVLWLTIALTAFYVWRKTSSAARALAGGALAYAVVAFHGGILPTIVAQLRPPSGWSAGSGEAMIRGQLVATLLLYFVLERRVALGLLKRLHHTVPFILACFIGAAMKGRVDAGVAWHAALLLLAFLVALAQNDYFDREEDAAQGRLPYIDGEGVIILSTIFLLFVVTFIAGNSVIGYILLLVFLVSVLYSFPMYRAKRYFPANLKIEGVWGACSFLVGVTAAIDADLPLGLENLSSSQAALEHSARIAAAFDAPTILALALVFGGWSMVAALKDYKDLRADARSGIQTVYTLAVRRSWGLRRVHRTLTIAVAVSLLAPLALLTWARAWPVPVAAGGVPFAVALLWATSRGPSRAGFHRALATINGLLVTVLAALLLER